MSEDNKKFEEILKKNQEDMKYYLGFFKQGSWKNLETNQEDK